jgi:hypothetical protein
MATEAADGVRVVPQRTSNAHHFNDPAARWMSPKSKPTGTPNQEFLSSMGAQTNGSRKQKNGRLEQARAARFPYMAIQQLQPSQTGHWGAFARL